jgi:hypothetical protein
MWMSHNDPLRAAAAERELDCSGRLIAGEPGQRASQVARGQLPARLTTQVLTTSAVASAALPTPSGTGS